MDTATLMEIESLRRTSLAGLREKYREVFEEETRCRHREHLFRCIAWGLQARAEGDLSERARCRAQEIARDADLRVVAPRNFFSVEGTRVQTVPRNRDRPEQDRRLPLPGVLLSRKWKGRTILVEVLRKGFRYENRFFFFPERDCDRGDRHPLERDGILRPDTPGEQTTERAARCGKIVWKGRLPGLVLVGCAARFTLASRQKKGSTRNLTRSTRNARLAEAFILSQRREGWIALPQLYDDGGFTGANMERPALGRLLQAVDAGELDCVVVYKVDRLSRSLLDFTQHAEPVREAQGQLRSRDTAVQYQHLTGQIDFEHPALVCPIRAGADRRKNARQDVGSSEEREMGGRMPGAWL